ncbi:MAG: hypothetical protein IJ661_07725 [Lachnospiraceae bacterium]|nr:hypothetical protein [Lachnospiraceae bacterium]
MLAVIVISWIVILFTSCFFYFFGTISLTKKNIMRVHNKFLNIKIIKTPVIIFKKAFVFLVVTLILFFIIIQINNRSLYKINIIAPFCEQKNVNILFDSKDNKIVTNDWLQVLHYNEVNGRIITRDTISDCIEELDNYYKNGMTVSKNRKLNDEEKRRVEQLEEDLGKIYDKSSDAFFYEAGMWSELYSLTLNPACLYQYARSMRDVIWNLTEYTENDYMCYCAEVIHSLEKFLEYYDKEINEGGSESIIITVKDVSFINMTIYYRIAMTMKDHGREEYVPNFWTLAYCCLLITDKNIDKDDELYVLVNYYMANIESNMVDYMKDKSLKTEFLDDAEKRYETAQKELNSKKSYKEEPNIRKSIEDELSLVKEKQSSIK